LECPDRVSTVRDTVRDGYGRWLPPDEEVGTPVPSPGMVLVTCDRVALALPPFEEDAVPSDPVEVNVAFGTLAGWLLTVYGMY
jgi:hypothetical protein